MLSSHPILTWYPSPNRFPDAISRGRWEEVFNYTIEAFKSERVAAAASLLQPKGRRQSSLNMLYGQSSVMAGQDPYKTAPGVLPMSNTGAASLPVLPAQTSSSSLLGRRSSHVLPLLGTSARKTRVSILPGAHGGGGFASSRQASFRHPRTQLQRAYTQKNLLGTLPEV